MNESMLCTKTHEYVLEQGDKYEVGITDYAIEQLGDIVFLELPEGGDEYAQGDTFANIESVKAASEIYMPVSGKIIEVNEELINSPELINEEDVKYCDPECVNEPAVDSVATLPLGEDQRFQGFSYSNLNFD